METEIQKPLATLISHTDAQEIIDMVCDNWKDRLIDMWAVDILHKRNILVPETLIQEGKRVASISQMEILNQIFKWDEIVTLQNLCVGDIKQIYNSNIEYNNSLIRPSRTRVDAFYLTDKYAWKIVMNEQGNDLLVVSRK